MIARSWHRTGRRDLFHVVVRGAPAASVEAESRAALERAVAEVERAGLPAAHIVRSRLWARDADARQIASNLRLEVLAGERRAASSSFIDAERLPAASHMAIELWALRATSAAAAKTIREYAPVIAPPMLVALDGLLVLSGNTDRSDTIEQQMAAIRANLDRSLAAGGGGWDRVCQVSVLFAKRLPAGAGEKELATRFPELRCPLMITTVEGYSNPEKLVEIEVAADLA